NERHLIQGSSAIQTNPLRPIAFRNFQDPPAPLGRRFLATLVDGLFVTFVGFVGAMVAGVLLLKLFHMGGSPVLVLLLIGSYAVGLVLLAKQTAKSGASVGKQLLGLRVVTENGYPLSFGAAFARTMGWWLGGAFVLPFFSVFFQPERRALHDLMVGTKVV
ncbi:MAG: RDD family protein, partial [Verrucomicrobiales bacterium]|nr:RDD family protein [Verrucomicrobiales bacterium]